MIDLLQQLLVVEIVLMTFIVFMTYLLIKLPASYKIKFIGIPVLIFGGFLAIQTFRDILGYPVPSSLPYKFTFLHYRVIHDNNHKNIEVWIIENNKSRLYVIPYTEKTEREMKEAKERANSTGIPQEGRTIKQRNQYNDTYQDIMLYPIPYQQLAPKDTDSNVQ